MTFDAHRILALSSKKKGLIPSPICEIGFDGRDDVIVIFHVYSCIKWNQVQPVKGGTLLSLPWHEEHDGSVVCRGSIEVRSGTSRCYVE